jgi:uncharacterized protein YdcH (DUF465 family)
MAETQLRPADDVKESLLRTDEAFRQLVSEHHDLDQQIRHLSTLHYLTDQQQYEATSMKKRKLALKDRIEAMVRARDAGNPTSTP